MVAVWVFLEVVEMDEVRMLQVEALVDAAQLNVEILANALESDLLAAVADAEIHLAEPAAADTALDRVPVERLLSGGIEAFHDRTPPHRSRHSEFEQPTAKPLAAWLSLHLFQRHRHFADNYVTRGL